MVLRDERRGAWFQFHDCRCHISELPKYSFIGGEKKPTALLQDKKVSVKIK